MSILARRLAASEGVYFLEESKHAIGRLAKKLPPSSPPHHHPIEEVVEGGGGAAADILPEVLRHSLPLKLSSEEANLSSSLPSLRNATKWVLPNTNRDSSSVVSPDVLNPLRAYVSLPQVTFGPKRWQLPNELPTFSASTANELRHDRYTPVDSNKLKAAAAGLTQVGKAFATATIIVFGGATLAFVLTVSKLQLNNTDDIRTKGRDLLQPSVDVVREQMVPLRTWAENMSRKWHIDREGEVKEKPIIKELAKTLGGRISD